jgi:hypothetical protein
VAEIGADTADLVVNTQNIERMRIASNGNVGIGTINPATVLHVAATAPRIRIEDSDATGTPYSEIRGDSGNLFYNANQNAALGGDHIWSSAGASNELMRIDSSGKVGIGTSTPANLLQIQGNATFEQSAGGQFAIRGSTNSQNRFNLGFDTINNYAWLQSITVGTAYRPIALNPSGGNVGIGTSRRQGLLVTSGLLMTGMELLLTECAQLGHLHQMFTFHSEREVLQTPKREWSSMPTATLVSVRVFLTLCCI